MKTKLWLCLAILIMSVFALSSPARAEQFDACSLLKDPGKRKQIGSGLERKLMIQCGEITTLAGPQGITGFDVEVPSSDLRINDPTLDGILSTQSETSVVAVGPIACAAWNDSTHYIQGKGFSGFGFSSNQGESFIDGGPFPVGSPIDRNYGDPSLAFSVRDNTIYYAALSDRGLSLWKSTDGCQSFQYVGPIHVGAEDDKELIAIDNNSGSSFYGRIYVGYTDFARNRNTTQYSDDGGLTWSTPVDLVGPTTWAIGMWPAVAPNGDVYFALVNRATTINGLQDQWIWKSTDGGATLTQKSPIAAGQRAPFNVTSSIACGRQALKGNIRYLSSPQIAIHRDSAAPAGYVIHAVYPYDSDGDGPDESNVFYRRSTDGAATWSAEVQLNDDGTTTDQFLPALAVSSTGTVTVSWYDRRLDSNNLKFDRFAVVSTDGGLTWGGNIRISSESSPVATTLPNFDPVVNNCYHGDYDQIATVAGNQCPRSQGYWARRSDAWHANSLTLGGQTYTADELLAILKTPVRQDASLILARQLIAAKLNSTGGVFHIVWSDDRRITGSGPNPDIYYNRLQVGHGSDPAPVSSTIGDADSLLSGFAGKLPYGVKPSSAVGRQMVQDAAILDAYNNGSATPYCTAY